MTQNADLEAGSPPSNQEEWRQLILTQMTSMYQRLSAGPVPWQEIEVNCRVVERNAWAARQGYPCPQTYHRGGTQFDGCSEGGLADA